MEQVTGGLTRLATAIPGNRPPRAPGVLGSWVVRRGSRVAFQLAPRAQRAASVSRHRPLLLRVCTSERPQQCPRVGGSQSPAVPETRSAVCRERRCVAIGREISWPLHAFDGETHRGRALAPAGGDGRDSRPGDRHTDSHLLSLAGARDAGRARVGRRGQACAHAYGRRWFRGDSVRSAQRTMHARCTGAQGCGTRASEYAPRRASRRTYDRRLAGARAYTALSISRCGALRCGAVHAVAGHDAGMTIHPGREGAGLGDKGRWLLCLFARAVVHITYPLRESGTGAGDCAYVVLATVVSLCRVCGLCLLCAPISGRAGIAGPPRADAR